MKEFLKKLWKRLFCKTVIVFLLGAILGCLGCNIPEETLAKFVCIFGVEGC